MQVESPTVKYGRGSYFVPADRDPWPHEIKTAKALAKAGYKIKFLSETGDSLKCDAEIDNEAWEFKAPRTDKMNQIQNNLKKANKKTAFIIIDSCRIKSLPDKKIQNYLAERLKNQKSIKKLLYINRKREIVDIGNLT